MSTAWKNRLKNKALWVSFASLVLLVLQTAGVGVDVGKWDTVVNSVLSFAVVAGLLNDPTTHNSGFGDDK
jgi:uncharacterized membrane protein